MTEILLIRDLLSIKLFKFLQLVSDWVGVLGFSIKCVNHLEYQHHTSFNGNLSPRNADFLKWNNQNILKRS